MTDPDILAISPREWELRKRFVGFDRSDAELVMKLRLMAVTYGDAVVEELYRRFFLFDARLPIVAMTAKALAGDREKCLAAGMDGYLRKPLELDALQAALAKWLPPERGTGILPVSEDKAPTHGQDARATHAPATPAPVPLDPATVTRWRALARDMNSNLFAEVLEIFREDAPQQARIIREAAETGDAHALRHAAHRLRGASLNLGALALAAWAARLEKLGADGTVAGAVAQLAEGGAELARVLAALEHERTAT